MPKKKLLTGSLRSDFLAVKTIWVLNILLYIFLKIYFIYWKGRVSEKKVVTEISDPSVHVPNHKNSWGGAR